MPAYRSSRQPRAGPLVDLLGQHGGDDQAPIVARPVERNVGVEDQRTATGSVGTLTNLEVVPQAVGHLDLQQMKAGWVGVLDVPVGNQLEHVVAWISVPRQLGDVGTLVGVHDRGADADYGPAASPDELRRLVHGEYHDGTWTGSKCLPAATQKMKKERADKIAKDLNNPGIWHSHSRGIPMSVLQRKLKLKIEDFGKNAELNDKIRAYYKLLVDYMMKRGHDSIVNTREQYNAIFWG